MKEIVYLEGEVLFFRNYIVVYPDDKVMKQYLVDCAIKLVALEEAFNLIHDAYEEDCYV